MKKVKMLVLSVLIAFIQCFWSVQSIHAEALQLQIEYPDGYSTGRLIYGNGGGQVCEDKKDHRLIQVGGQDRFLGVFKLNGELVYCIQPFVETKSGYAYTSTSIEDLNMDPALLEKLELASYFGYGYKNDDSLLAAIATQHAIWEYQGANVSEITQEVRDKISVIKQRVWEYQNKIKPSFHDGVFTFKGIGKENAIVLKDTNHVLKDWFLTNASQGLCYEIKDDLITVWVEEAFFDTKTVDFNLYDPNDSRTQGNSIVYINPQNAQQLAKFSSPVKRSFQITFTMASGSIEVTKYMNSNSQGTGEQTLEKGAEFIVVKKVYADQYGGVDTAYGHKDLFYDYEYDYLVTDENGFAKSKTLGPGEYILKQVKGAVDTVLLEKEYTFTIQSNKQTPFMFTFTNVKYASMLKIIKKDEKGEVIIQNPATFKIRYEDGKYVEENRNGKMVDTWSTDSNGTLILPFLLDAGKYYLEETIPPKGFVLQKESIPFVITNKTNITYDENQKPITIVEMKNEKCEGSIVISKKFEGSAHQYGDKVEFALYANMDIYDPTNKQLIYKENDLVKTYTLGQSKILEMDGLPMGYNEASYYVKEISTYDTYQWNDQKYIFDLKQEDITQKKVTIRKEITNYLIQLHSKLYARDSETTTVYSQDNLHMKDVIIYKGLHPNKTYIMKGAIVNERGDIVVDKDGKQMTSMITFTTNQKDGEIVLEYDGNFEGYKECTFIAVAYLYNDKNELLSTHDDLHDNNQHLYLKPLYDVEIQKVDALTKERVQDYFVFSLYKDLDCMDEWREVKSTKNGSILLKGLKYGTYYLKEKKAPKGYKISDTVYILKIDETGIYFNGQKIDENNCILKIENQKYKVVDTGDKNILLFLMGIVGSFLFLQKQKKKLFKR